MRRRQQLPTVQAQPFVKWAGGKRHLAAEIIKRLPPQIGTYYEPFFGGGAVFFQLAQGGGGFQRALLNDTNQELMHTCWALKTEVVEVIAKLRRLKYDEETYYRVRDQDWLVMDRATLAARFIYLNRCCFNGLYRVNQSGKFNVPFGRYTNPTICDVENLTAVARVLRPKGVMLAWKDFESSLANVRQGDAVYFDPPYIPLSETSNFASYTRDGFTLDDQKRLRDVAANLVRKGIAVVVSNSDTLETRTLYRGFRIEVVQAPRRINSKAAARGNVNELIITGKKK